MTDRATSMGLSIAQDLKSISERISKVARGQVRMVDLDTQLGLRIIEDLEFAAKAIPVAIIPAKE